MARREDEQCRRSDRRVAEATSFPSSNCRPPSFPSVFSRAWLPLSSAVIVDISWSGSLKRSDYGPTPVVTYLLFYGTCGNLICCHYVL